MKENNIRCKKARKSKKTRNSNYKFPVLEDRLKRRFTVAEVNRAWVSDITYLKMRDGWLYFCVGLIYFLARWSAGRFQTSWHQALSAMR